MIRIKLSESDILDIKKSLFDHTYLKNEKNRDMPFTEEEDFTCNCGSKCKKVNDNYICENGHVWKTK